MKRNQKGKTNVPLWCVVLISIVVGLMIVALFLFRPQNNAFKNFVEFLNFIENKCETILKDEYASTFAAQVSLTFISISVLSVLSDKDHIIYWKNIVESRLVEPPFRCFAAYTTYSITTIGISLSGLVFDNCSLLAVGFLLDIIVLVFLTKSMLDIYFARTKIKNQLEREFINATEEEKIIIIEKFHEYIVKAISSNDFSYLKETFSFIIKNRKLFGDEYITLMGWIAKADKATVQFFAKCFLERDYVDILINKDEKGLKHLEFNNVFWEEYVYFCKKEYANADFVYDIRLQNLADLFINRVLNFYNAAVTILRLHNSQKDYQLIDLQKWEESKKFVTDSGEELTSEVVNVKLNQVFLDAAWGNPDDTDTSNAAWYFVYSIIKAFVEIFAERIERESARNKDIKSSQETEGINVGVITLQQQYGFKKAFENLPFYKVFASDEFMPPDAFPEHREFIDFLAKS